MPQNDVILLNRLLEQRREEVAQDLTDSEYFDLFTADQVLKDYDLSHDDLESGIVDGSGDGGIDSVYFFVNNVPYYEDLDTTELRRNVHLRLVLIQSKTGPGFSESAIDRFTASALNLFNLEKNLEELQDVYNEGLLTKIEQFRHTFLELTSRFPTVSFEYAYATKGFEVHHNVKRRTGMLKETIEGLFNPVSFSFDFLTASDLLKSARQSPSTTSCLSLAENPISTGQEGFVCLVKLKDYLDFITDDEGHLRSSIFEGNVRDYQGSTEVNTEIRTTLASNGMEDFWWLNNGVSIVCDDASLSGKRLTIENAEIVNGLQSSREIYETFTGKDVSDEQRNLLVRVLKPKNPESRDRIIKATNSQTSIPAASLRATDKIHRDIEDFLFGEGYYYDRRKNHHKNTGKPLKKILSIPFVAQCVLACALYDPDNARARPSSLIKKDSDYKRIFNLEYPLGVYLKCPIIVRTVESFIKQSNNENYRKHQNNIRFYVSMLWILRQYSVRRPSLDQIAEIDISALTEQSVTEIVDVVWKEYVRLGGNDQVAKGPDLKREILVSHHAIISI